MIFNVYYCVTETGHNLEKKSRISSKNKKQQGDGEQAQQKRWEDGRLIAMQYLDKKSTFY